jgi:hypothetical protein
MAPRFKSSASSHRAPICSRAVRAVQDLVKQEEDGLFALARFEHGHGQ